MSVIGKPVLYSYWRSSCSWRVRIALNLKEIPYDIKPVSLIKSGGEQHSNEYREINPMEQVPALQIDGHTFVESVAFYKCKKLIAQGQFVIGFYYPFISLPYTRPEHTMTSCSQVKKQVLCMCKCCGFDTFIGCKTQLQMPPLPLLSLSGCGMPPTITPDLSIMHYLEETRPGRPLMPADVTKRAKVREICEVIASGIQPLQNLIVLIYVGEEKKKEWAQHWINRGFRAVEKLLSASAGKYCVGDEVTLADCCLVPQVFNARRFHVDLRPFPIILRIDRELENHPAFRAAHPSNQPDCPPEATK